MPNYERFNQVRDNTILSVRGPICYWKLQVNKSVEMKRRRAEENRMASLEEETLAKYKAAIDDFYEWNIQSMGEEMSTMSLL